MKTHKTNSRILVGAAFALAAAGAGAGLLVHVRALRSAPIKPPSGKVAPWTAMKTASVKTGGKAFQATFEYEDGRWQYGVLVVKGGKISEVEINATTGVVGDVEGITPAGEAKEMRADLEAMAKSGGK
ncbi:MAG: PepSY domain-containing protein [Fimbriimonadaceae bacterium]